MFEGELALAAETDGAGPATTRSFSSSEPAPRRGRRPRPGRRRQRAPPKTCGRSTAACWIRWRSNGGNESSRAARTPWTVSGNPSSSSSFSARRRTISSANSGLPSERSATSETRCRRRGKQPRHELAGLLRSQRLEPERGRVAAAASPVGPAFEQLVARQAEEQQRARTHWARCSIRSSIPSSAQWMSSNVRTSGRSRRNRLDQERTAAKSALAAAEGPRRRGQRRRRLGAATRCRARAISSRRSAAPRSPRRRAGPRRPRRACAPAARRRRCRRSRTPRSTSPSAQ